MFCLRGTPGDYRGPRLPSAVAEGSIVVVRLPAAPRVSPIRSAVAHDLVADSIIGTEELGFGRPAKYLARIKTRVFNAFSSALSYLGTTMKTVRMNSVSINSRTSSGLRISSRGAAVRLPLLPGCTHMEIVLKQSASW